MTAITEVNSQGVIYEEIPYIPSSLFDQLYLLTQFLLYLYCLRTNDTQILYLQQAAYFLMIIIANLEKSTLTANAIMDYKIALNNRQVYLRYQR